MGPDELTRAMAEAGVESGGVVALVVTGDIAVMVAEVGGPVWRTEVSSLAAVETALGPRWIVWSQSTLRALVDAGLRVGRAWDLVAVHRLLFGGWELDPGRVWARLNGLATASMPEIAPIDLFHTGEPEGPDDEPLDADGYVRADWAAGGWSERSARVDAWARLARRTAALQQGWIDARPDRARLAATARSESATEILCAELAADGLPLDRATALAIIERAAGPRPTSEADERAIRAARDALVLQHAPGPDADLRSPGQVRSLLRRAGIEVPDTRAHRLERLRGEHPVIDALLAWRKAERIATTYGYGWLDACVVHGPTPERARLRGEWSGSDGAAGRMTATSGLHNLPAEMRPAVRADPGWVFVRADLGQIEPRVLAAVSGDPALARACLDDDLYTPVARQLGVERAVAKVAVLGAMYGQTTGRGAQALRGLQANYPTAMAYLDDADRRAQVGHDLTTFGGRRVRMGIANANDASDRDLRSHAAARGRYGRNAMVQGAAAEMFKQWAVTVRARVARYDASVVLCLHDELLVHTPEAAATDVAALVEECLQEVAHRWAPAPPAGAPAVRFLADLSVVESWADAKA